MIKDDGRRSTLGSESGSPMLMRRQTYAANSEPRPFSRRSRSLASVPFTRRWSLNTAAAGRALPTVPSASPATPSGGSQTEVRQVPVASRYADASVQTEAYEPSPSEDGSLGDDRPSTPMYQLTAEISRPDVDSDMRPRQNPIRIGAMSMFFRTPGYRLGDALS